MSELDPYRWRPGTYEDEDEDVGFEEVHEQQGGGGGGVGGIGGEERVRPTRKQRRATAKEERKEAAATTGGGGGGVGPAESAGVAHIRIDLIEEKDKYIISADLPGQEARAGECFKLPGVRNARR